MRACWFSSALVLFASLTATSSAAVLMLAAPADNEQLAKSVEAITQRPEYKQARWGILIVDAASGAVVYELQPDRLFVPASTTKLYSGAAALIAWGAIHRFVTPVYQRGQIKEGVSHGDLILVASGDLAFGARNQTLFRDVSQRSAPDQRDGGVRPGRSARPDLRTRLATRPVNIAIDFPGQSFYTDSGSDFL
jgi:D-alanyl-D-alanine carboxypeptidase